MAGQVRIGLVHGDADEGATRDQLVRLLDRYDLSAWTWTDTIAVDRAAIPHSHPVLTLHTRHRLDDDLLLATYVHEQLHWFLAERPDATRLAVDDLRQAFPSVPIGYPEGGNDDASTYLHLLVGLLEHQALVGLVGELRARQTIEFWASDHYTWVYRTVLDRPGPIRMALRDHDLTPIAMSQ